MIAQMNKTGANKAARDTKPRPRAEATRAKIMATARKVFSRYPYPAASMRMIGKEGGFDHEIIRYHFPSKAALFETIAREICEDLYQANQVFLEGLASKRPEEGFALYLDRFLDYHYAHPEALRIIELNMSLSEDPQSIPGYRHIPEVLTRTRATFQEKIPLTAAPEQLERFLNSFNNLLLSYLASGYCQALTLGLEPDSRAYRAWVKKTLLEIFLPHLKRLIGESGIDGN